MQAMIDELAKQAAESLGQVSSKETLASFWQEYLSKNGKIPALMKNLRTVAPEERPAMGKIINELKQKVQADYDAAAETVKQAELAARNAAETVDITLPAKTRPMGGLHPLTLITNQIIDVFSGMGFSVGTFPEIEDDDHNFTRLNVPKDHPARDMQDTFYLSEEFLLRTQTSGGQIRTMDVHMNLDYMMFGEISETEREWQQKDAMTLIHIIEKAPASQRNYAIRLLKLFIAATGNSPT